MTAANGGEDEFSHDFDTVTDLNDRRLRVARRCAYFVRTFRAFIGSLQNEGIESAFINNIVLANAVQSYFQDIERLKNYHNIKRADRFKIAGYTVKWLTGAKPIQIPEIENTSPLGTRLIPVLNDGFSLISALHIAGVNTDKATRHFGADMLYSSHYRTCDPTLLVQMFELAAMHWPAQGVVPKPKQAG